MSVSPRPLKRAVREEKVEKVAKVAANQILLLNQEMPNGQRMRHCTGMYIAKLGGQYARAGKKAAHKLMGQVFDEQSLREYIDAVWSIRAGRKCSRPFKKGNVP